MKVLMTALVLFVSIHLSTAQETNIQRTSRISVGLHQVKESANTGLVFKGPAIRYGMRWDKDLMAALLSYENDLGFGVLFSKNMPALDFYFKPAEFSYLFKTGSGEDKFYIGPALKFEYYYDLYPELQSGFDYWFTDFSLDLKSRYDFTIKRSFFRVIFNFSVMGFVSRQPEYRDPYFFDIGVKYAIRHLHQDMSFGTVNTFNSSKLEIQWKPGHNKRLTLGYSMEYLGFYKDPDISIFNHQITLIIAKK